MLNFKIKKYFPKTILIILKKVKTFILEFYPYHFLRYKGLINIDYKINEKLIFGSLENSFYKKKLKSSKFYLEYGSGFSTYLSKKYKKNFLSVESDKNFYLYMLKSISKKNFLFIDFNVVKYYAYPYSEKKNKLKAIDYAELVLKKLYKQKKFPDLVLVDGRYRVLVGLFLFKYYHKLNKKFTFIFDDYYFQNSFIINRPHYKILDKFFNLKKVGRFAVATSIKKKSVSNLNQNICKYSLDPR